MYYTVFMNDQRPLSAQHLKFVKEYLVDHDGMAAAIRAGYVKTHAGTQAHVLLKLPEIQKFLRSQSRVFTARKNITAEQVVEELREIAFDRLLKPTERMQALELLGKYIGMWKENFNNINSAERHEIIITLLSDEKVAAKVKQIFDERGIIEAN